MYKKEILKKAQSKFSLSSPIVDNDTSPNARAYKQEIAWEDSDVVRLENRAGKMVVLKTDISRFYPSIYTHIIPWVVEGKIEAKKDRSNINKLGNMLDKTFEWSQDGQTFGLPIGPDISFIIAEVILRFIVTRFSIIWEDLSKTFVNNTFMKYSFQYYTVLKIKDLENEGVSIIYDKFERAYRRCFVGKI